MWYTITITVEAGTGDYGSTQRTMIDTALSTKALCAHVNALEMAGHQVRVFRGKHRGTLQYATPSQEHQR